MGRPSGFYPFTRRVRGKGEKGGGKMFAFLTSLISGGFDTLTVIEVVGRGVIIKQVPRNLTSVKAIYGSFSTNALIRPYIYVKKITEGDNTLLEINIPEPLISEVDIKAFHEWLDGKFGELERVLKEAEEEAGANGGQFLQNTLGMRKTLQTFTVRSESGGIRLSLPGGLKAEIWDASGKRVGTYRGSRFVSLKPGIYFVKVGGEVKKAIVR